MASLTIFRPAPAPEASAPVPETGVQADAVPAPLTSGGTERRERPWWRRLPALAAQPPHEIQHACLERLLALLEGARAELSAGWVQGGWWAARSPAGRLAVLTGIAAAAAARGPVSAVCLVGALIRAGSGQGEDSEAGRAIDAVYHALWESQGQPAATSGRGLLMVSSPQVRQARVQTLARWNDAAGRNGNEVLAVVDRAIALVIQDLAAIPAPPLPGSRARSCPLAGTGPR